MVLLRCNYCRDESGMETLVIKTQEFIAVLAILTVVILLLAIRLGWQIARAFF
jgi:hypothetical protein